MREDYTFCPKNPLSVIAQTCLKHNFQSYRFGWPEIEKQSNEKKNEHDFDFTACRLYFWFGIVRNHSNYVKQQQKQRSC